MKARAVNRRHARPGFTLIELLIAGMVAALTLGAVTLSMSQISKTKNTSRARLEAHLRADEALNAIRRDVVSIVRADDLFYSRVYLQDNAVGDHRQGYNDRDDLLIYNTSLRSSRNEAYLNEGMEYETQFRVMEDEAGPVLWQRRDAMPDAYELGGGVALPLVEGVVGFNIEAYDGSKWYDEWDSDDEGLPWALRITVTASGHRDGEAPMDSPVAVLRTVVSLDRVPPPADLFPDEPLPVGGTDSTVGGSAAEGGRGFDAGAAGDPNAAPPPGSGLPRPGGGGGGRPRPSNGGPRPGQGGSQGGQGGNPNEGAEQPMGGGHPH